MALPMRRRYRVPAVFLAGLLSLQVAQALEPPPRNGPASSAPIQDNLPTHPREPWKWSLEERLAVRFDPNDMRRRAEEHAAGEKGLVYPEGACLVDGARNPELFLPHELFRHLLHKAFNPVVELREFEREILLKEGRALGFDESLWAVLETLAKDEIRMDSEVREQAKRRREAGKPTPVPDTERLKVECTKRAVGREAVSAYYGTERFDRFLYKVIAPQLNILMPSNPEWQRQLRFLEEGCQ